MQCGSVELIRHAQTALVCASLSLGVHLHAAFSVPSGFTVEKVASEPEVRFPMFAAFDDKGRLFVTESSGGDLYKEISAQTRLCKVRLLEDADNDGTFERSKVFADKINFPMGLAWRDGKLYLADPPDLVTLVDTNNDERADVRTVLVTGFGHRDNGSLHGLTFGLDGWLYMTCGEPDGYKIKRPDGSLLEGYNGALLRCRPDGSNIEVLCRGFVNLVEVVFTPAGEIIGTDNWFRWPSGGVRDALVHLVPGGLYPLHLKDVGTQHPVLSDPLPPVSLFPAVALSGLARYKGRNFPGDMHGNLFAAEHNSRKVSRHVLSRDGSTFKAEPNDFLSTDDPDFHPSDVLEAPDGSLLVLDTGSWYIDHCPTGRIRKSPATGGIYRVRFTGESTAKATHAREVDRVWALAPNHDDAASAQLRRFLTAENSTVASAAARVLALRLDRAAEQTLAKMLSSPKAELRLASAEALAHCGTSNSLPAIWRAFDDSPDHFLEHALSYAAHHIADAEALRAVLDHPNLRVRRTALLLLNQPPRPREALTADTIRPHLISPDESLRRTALQVLQNRPEWVDAARKFLRELAESPRANDQLRAAVSDLALAFKTDPHVQRIVGQSITNGSLEVRLAALDVCARSAFPKVPDPWIQPLHTALSDPSVRAHALRAVAALNVSTFDDVLNRIADNANEPPPVRVQAIGILTARSSRLSEDRFTFFLQQMRDNPLAALASADVLRRAHLDDAQLNAALKALPPQSPVVPGSLLGSLRECTSSASAAKLLDTIATFAGNVAGEDLAALEAKLPTELRPRVKELQALSEKRRVADHAKLDKFMSLLDSGDADRGRSVFFDAKTACATCHAIGSEGGKVGPDLTKIGAIRSGRDILESVVLPSSTFAQTYEPYAVLTKDGRELTGTLARQETDSILLRDATGSELHLPRNLVRELRRQEISIMPEGLEGGLSDGEFRDLLAFLQSLK